MAVYEALFQLPCMFYNLLSSRVNKCRLVRLTRKTRKRFSEKPIVAFTNSTVFILDFYIMTKPVWFHVFAWSALPTIPDHIRYNIGVLCDYFKSQTNILLHINKIACVKAEI